MFNINKYEGKTKEEALKKCLEDLNVLESDLIITESETEAKLFKAKKVEIEVVLKKDVISAIKEFLKELASKMNITINSEVKEKDNNFLVVLVSDSNSILIGKDGRTLNSIQLLLKQTINNNNKFNIKVLVDVSDYKARKQKNIEYEVKKIAREVLNTKVEAKLDPMNSYERRIVHEIISEYAELETESFGEGMERHVVIRYKKD